MTEYKAKEPSFNEQNGIGSRIGGVFLVLLGAIFLLWQADIPLLGDSPWLLFLAIPVFWILYAAWCQYVRDGRRLTRAVLTKLLWGLFPFAFVAAIVLGVQVNLVWPFVLILIGISTIWLRPTQ